MSVLGEILASSAFDNPTHFSTIAPAVPVTDPVSSTIKTWNSSYLEFLALAYSVVVGASAICLHLIVVFVRPKVCSLYQSVTVLPSLR